jgi:hypothetical protein
MSFGRFNANAVDESGDIQGSSQVEVRRVSDNGLAGLYSDKGTTNIGNPFTCGSDGDISFYTANEVVNVTATKGAFNRTWSDVSISGTAATADTGTAAGQVPLNSDLGSASQLDTVDVVTRITGSEYIAYGGTADAITLTSSRTMSALTTGQEFRFRATAANTGAATINVDGIGAVTAKTITGAALPADYIRTDTVTVCRYDGTDFIVDREIERDSNANGEYVLFADGTAQLTHILTPSIAVNAASSFGGFISTMQNWTLPHTGLTSVDSYEFTARFDSAHSVRYHTISTSVIGYSLFTVNAVGVASREVSLAIKGRWY